MTSNQISTYKKTNFISHKQYLFGLLSSRNAKETHTDQIREHTQNVSEQLSRFSPLRGEGGNPLNLENEGFFSETSIL